MTTTFAGSSSNATSFPTPPPRARRQAWIGRAVSTLVVLAMTSSAIVKLAHVPDFVARWTGRFGFAESALTPIALLELACVALYALPRTSALGALALTAYLGGAVATHVRVSDPFVVPVVLGLLAWVGLALRESNLRLLLAPRVFQRPS